MKYKAIMFDLDGTLLPMDMQEFTKGYFKLLYKKLNRFPVDEENFVKAVWAATGSMVKNNGDEINRTVFWRDFEKIVGFASEEMIAESEKFYSSEFNEAKCFTGENPLAVEAVKLAREKAEYVILATNPLFPTAGQRTRLSWIGLSAQDFDLVTDYSSDRFCKPNPEYFADILDRMGLKPEECLHIGNDEFEDMYACEKAGIDGYLVTDNLIPSDKYSYEGPRGSFADMIEMLRKL